MSILLIAIFLTRYLPSPSAGFWRSPFSPDGQLLATGNANCEIHVWRVSDRQRLFTLQGHTGWVRKIAFSPDGQTLASASEDGTVKLWTLPDGECQSTLCNILIAYMELLSALMGDYSPMVVTTAQLGFGARLMAIACKS
jgi:WD40 repeat protein